MKTAILVTLLAAMVPCHPCLAQGANALGGTTAPAMIDLRFTPEIGGIRQIVDIKTDDARKPVLLFLSGGPGSSMINGAPSFTDKLKSRFTIVQWDQRDAGKTLALNPSPTRPTLVQMKQDTVDVIDFVRKELRQEKIFLLGSSWGNVLGFHIVQTRPAILHGYFAVNPVVSQLASEQALLATLRNHFKENSLATTELATVNIPFKSDDDLLYLRKWLFYKDGKTNVLSEQFKAGFTQWSAQWSAVWNEVMATDLPKSLASADCPVYFLVGANDIQTLTSLTETYFAQLKAPKKALFKFERSGHQIHHDEPAKFQDTIIQASGLL